MPLGRIGVYKGAMAVKNGQDQSAGLIKSHSYLAITVMASLVLSFILLGGAILPAEAAKKSGSGNSPPPSDNSTTASSKNKESKVNNGPAAAAQEQQQQQKSGSATPAAPDSSSTSSSSQLSTSDPKRGSKILVADDKDLVTAGDTQTVYVAVMGVDYKTVPNATVFATVFFGKNIEKKFTSSTLDDGTVVFTWQIDKHNKTGLIGMDIRAEATGYDTGYGSLVFKYKN